RCLLLFRQVEQLGVVVSVLCRVHSAFVVHMLFDVVSSYHLGVTEYPATIRFGLLRQVSQSFFALLAVACDNDSLVSRCPLSQLFWPRNISRDRRSSN